MKNDEESATHDLFPPVGNFNAVVPLSEIDANPVSHVTAPAPSPTTHRRASRAAAGEREQDEQEEATLVPARVARTALPLRPATRRPSWPVMIMALALALFAGLAAGVYLIKSGMPVEIQAPASVTENVAHEATAETTNSQPTQVASESNPDARPQAETNLDAVASKVDTEVSAEKTGRDLNAPKRSTAADASSGRAERIPDTASTKAAVAERTPERPARKAPPSTTDKPAQPEAVRTRRAASEAERTPVLRAPERSLPVSSPPSSAKSKRVIQWP
jgi:hypothetical protein